MSVNVCDCGAGNLNLGTPSCPTVPSVGKKYIIVPLVDNAGEKNRINIDNDTLDASYFSGKYNEADGSQRWYPTPKIKNLADLRDDPIKETFNDGSSGLIQEGQRKVSALFPNVWGKYLEKMQGVNCVDNGVYEVGLSGELMGIYVVEGGVQYLEPAPIESDSFYARQLQATDTTGAHIQIEFEYDSTMNDANFKMVTKAEMDNHNLLKDNGLLDLNIAISNISTAGFTATVTQDFGTAFNPNKVEGLLLADFSAAEIAPTPAAIPLTSVTESAAGVYDVLYTAPQTSLDTQTTTINKIGLAITESAVFATP